MPEQLQRPLPFPTTRTGYAARHLFVPQKLKNTEHMAPKPDRWRYQDPMQVDDSACGLACAWARPVSITTASTP